MRLPWSVLFLPVLTSLRAVFGYFRCDTLGQVATLDPVPRSALATKLRLVK
jgi:hypothetical protein